MGFFKWVTRLAWWALVFFISLSLVSTGSGKSEELIYGLFIWLGVLLFFYANRYLFRKVLRRGYFWGYFFLAIIQILGLWVLADIGLGLKGLEEYFAKEITVSEVELLLPALLVAVLVVNLQVTIYKDWFRSVVIEKRLAKTEHQLARVKLNPHFLKNVLNDLYSMVYLKKDEAAEAVVELKALMEYLIYDSDVNYIPLHQELDAAKQIINIQKHRLPPHVSINYQLFIEQNDVVVPPMVFFPFLENVFRHADLSSQGALIDVKLRVKNNTLMYRVKSKLAKEEISDKKPGGIGLKTLEDRLYESYGLLGYSLDSKKKNGLYYAKLDIYNLKKD